jgi:predicted CXXCH cytochrome family protein
MTQVASPTAVVAPFEDIELESRGRKYRIWRHGDEFWVEMADPDWEVEMLMTGADLSLITDPPMVRRQIVMTTGSHHIQCYWVASRNGNELRQFPWQYHLESGRWIPSEDTTLQPPDSHRHFGHWNSTCIACHSLGGKPGLDLHSGHLLSQVAEFGISCEACHGPGREHARQHRNPIKRYQQHLGKGSDPTIVNPALRNSKVSSQICGQCHSTFLMTELKDYFLHGDNYRAGDDLEKSRHMLDFKNPHPQMVADARNGFWRDGTTRVGGREYLGLIQSPCYQRGEMSCLSCHSMHRSDPNDQLAFRMESNHACLQCHTNFSQRIAEHSHHEPGSPGSRCYNCHMPHTTYALFKGIRSHRIDSPSVTVSVNTGRPNACNLCHLDRSLEWTTTYLTQWYGQSTVKLNSEEKEIAASVLWLLRGDAAQRVIVAWHMGWSSAQQASGADWQAPFLAQLLDDPYSAIRFVAFRSLQTLAPFGDFEYDFIGSPEQRLNAKQRALQLWNRHRVSRPNRYGMRALFDAEGQFLQKTVDRLVQARDDRPVSISE